MTKHDEARRAFLLGAAVGAGAVAGATLVPDALAQTHEPPTTGTDPAHSHAGGPGLGAFFNSEDAATVCGIYGTAHARRAGPARRARRGRAQLYRSSTGGRLRRPAVLLSARARLARCVLPQNLQRTLPASLRRATGRGSYADLEPYYDRAEYELGVSGKAGNLQGKKV